MIEPYLADLILEHGDDLNVYLRLLAISVRDGNMRVRVPEDVNGSDIKNLVRSGFLVEDSKEPEYVQLGDADYHCKPKAIRKVVRKESQPHYVPLELDAVAKNIGYPIDWMSNRGRYLAQYHRVIKKVGKEELLAVSKYISDNKIPCPLSFFLSENGHSKYKQMMLNPPKVDEKYQDRVKEDDYDAEQSF